MSGELDEERVGELLAHLPPAPEAWVDAAKQLPRARGEIDRLVELAALDAQFARALRDDPEAALRARNLALPPRLWPELQTRIDQG